MFGRAFIGLLQSITACETADPQGAVVSDSAEVQVVTSSAPAWPEGGGRRVADLPDLRLGSVDAAQEQQFSRIRGAVRLQDGTIAVPDGASHEIRFFTADGAFAGAAVGRGSGPGEFRMIALYRLHRQAR